MSMLQKTDDETTRRQIRAREILAEARALLVGHLSPHDRRAVEAFALAQADIGVGGAPSDPIERQAALWRRQRIQRELADARATLARGVHKPPSDVPGKIVHKIKENAHVAPEAPDPNLNGRSASAGSTPPRLMGRRASATRSNASGSSSTRCWPKSSPKHAPRRKMTSNARLGRSPPS